MSELTFFVNYTQVGINTYKKKGPHCEPWNSKAYERMA